MQDSIYGMAIIALNRYRLKVACGQEVYSLVFERVKRRRQWRLRRIVQCLANECHNDPRVTAPRTDAQRVGCS